MDKHFSFFSNRECEYFPCHKGVAPEEFNCLFCYCPLYTLGDTCGGNCRYTKTGIKDCSACVLPHKKESYGYITDKFQMIVDLMKKPC
ncbi:MAG: cysteine-rich small domain-containing protein [Lachnospiraceae bacterium]